MILDRPSGIGMEYRSHNKRLKYNTHMKNSLLLIVLLTLLRASFGQSRPAINVPSPNAQSLGVFGEFPQSDFTGVPAINVPLYNIKYRSINIPISLNYNSNLLKADIMPGWVGLGWNLSAGGSITRAVNGLPDDSQYTDVFLEGVTGEVHVGYYYNYATLSQSDWSSTTKITQSSNDWNQYPDYNHHVSHGGSVKDYAPDEFSFSFLGYSGTFYLDHNRNWKVRSKKHFKIDVMLAGMNLYDSSMFGGSSGFYKFTVTDDQGIKYVFGGDQRAIEFSKTLFTTDEAPYIPKTWNLTQIILPNNEVVNFTYERGGTIASLTPWYAVYNGAYLGLNGSAIAPSYLTSISTSLETVKFHRAPSTQRCYSQASLTLEKNKWSTNQGIYFNQPYNNYYDATFSAFGPVNLNGAQYPELTSIEFSNSSKYDFSYSSSTGEKLKLLRVAKISTLNNVEGDRYDFSYNPLVVTNWNYLSMLTDLWGYNNGRPVDLSNLPNFLASRQPDVTAEQAELLNRVTYPTKGYTEYEYELNSYTKCVNNPRSSPLSAYAADQACGGLRIKKVTDYSAAGAVANSVNYFYDTDHYGAGSGHLSSGVLGGQPFYDVNYNNATPTQIDLVFFNSILPSSYNNNGSHIGYSEVTEEYRDGSYKVNKFSNFDNGNLGEYMDEDYINYLTSSIDYLDAFTSHAYERGNLLSTETRNASHALLSQITYHYSRVSPPLEEPFVRALNTKTISTTSAPGAWVDYYLGRSFKINTFAYLLDQATTVYWQNPSAPITKNVTYLYDPLTLNLTNTLTQNSGGQNVETVNTYPADMVGQNRDPAGVYAHMVANNTVAPVVENITKVNSTQTVLHRSDYTEPYTNIFKPSQDIVQYGNNPPLTAVQYAYDPSSNLSDFVRPGGPASAFLYAYNKNLPVAKASNANSSECFYEGFEETGTYGPAHTGLRSTSVPYNATFAPASLSSRRYVIDYFYHNTSTNKWQYAVEDYLWPHGILPASADAIDDVRIYPADAQMESYTYDPLAGMTSTIDAKGKTTFYEYDALGRLANIKDQDGNIVKSMCYNFAGQYSGCGLNMIYTNVAQPSKDFVRNCGPGYLGSTVTYPAVPAGRYFSNISQGDADNKALSEISINGPVYAATNGTCAQIVYARLEIQNIYINYYGYDPYDPNDNSAETDGDLYIRFYTDEACTHPYVLPADMDVSFEEVLSYSYYYNGPHDNPDQHYPGIITGNAGSSEISLGNYDLRYNSNTGYFSSYQVLTFNILSLIGSPYIPTDPLNPGY